MAGRKKGFKHTEESKRLMSLNHTYRRIWVSQYDLNGKKIKTFEGIRNAAKATGVNQGNISKVCKGQRMQAGGYIWRYD